MEVKKWGLFQTHGKALRDEEQVKLNLELSHIIHPTSCWNRSKSSHSLVECLEVPFWESTPKSSLTLFSSTAFFFHTSKGGNNLSFQSEYFYNIQHLDIIMTQLYSFKTQSIGHLIQYRSSLISSNNLYLICYLERTIQLPE